MIPKIIHTIWPGEDFDRYEALSHFTLTWLLFNPRFSIVLWILDNLPRDKLLGTTLEIVDSSLHPVVKSDILRLDLLRIFGGIYRDADMECLSSFSDLLDSQFVKRSGYPEKGAERFCGIMCTGGQNALIACEAGDEIISEAAVEVGKSILSKKDEILSSENPYSLIIDSSLRPSCAYLDKFEVVYPRHYFYMREVDKHCYCRHHWYGGKAGGWVHQIKKGKA